MVGPLGLEPRLAFAGVLYHTLLPSDTLVFADNKLVLQHYKYRAYLTKPQQAAAANTFGCVRVVFNDFVAERNRLFEEGLHRDVKMSDTFKKVTTHAKRTAEREWLREVSSVPLQQAVRDAQRGYQNFYDSLSGRRKGSKMRPPRMKKKGGKQTARFTRNANFEVTQTTHGVGYVLLKKIGRVRFALSRALPSEPSSVTLIREADGTYHVSFVVEVSKPVPSACAGRVAGLDAGIGDDLLAITYSDGTREKVLNPRTFRNAQKKLAKAQRDLSRKTPGSKRREKARIKAAKAYSKTKRVRYDCHHKLAAKLVAENDIITIEDLSLIGMARMRLSKSVYDAGIGTLYRLIQEKAENQGRIVIKINRWAPTSQVCSVCGTPGGKKPLNIRVWTCEGCGTVLDRDWNAAVNIMVAAGLAETLNARGGSVRRVLASAGAADPVETRTRRTPLPT